MKNLQKRWTSPTFRRFFATILVAEAITICVAALLLNLGISGWIHERTARAIQISQAAAASGGWERISAISKASDSPAFQMYERKMSMLSNRYFGNETGEVYLVIVQNGEAYESYPGTPYPMEDTGKALPWEIEAYKTGKTRWNDVPYSDSDGTYLAAFTPVSVKGKIVGLVAAEYDMAPFADFQSIVYTAFWLSLVPAVLVALVIAWFLAGIFIEPIELFRRIEEARIRPAEGAPPALVDPLVRLTPKEREVTDLVRQGLTNREIAQRLVITQETVKQHLKNIREKTGFNKIDLAVQAEASRLRGTEGVA